MADIIQLLPDSVANQIAAGEVIQRPASVVKELIENAIDAGSSSIKINIKDAGKTLIQITDDGAGMSETDARMAFERHATSKIKRADDLFAIRTMGFRGEALASIAAIAEVELKTKQSHNELGTLIRISGSEVECQEPVSCGNGTNFMVKNLFFNVPARRKFLKANSTEFRHIVNEFQRVALANPELAFSLYHNDSVVYDLPSENLKRRVVHIFGKNMNNRLIPLNVDTDVVKISGYVGQPKYAKKRFGEQFFFVNHRYMKHPYFHKAVMQAFEKLVPADTIPSYFINFEIDPASIDINIHPTKTEIKFEDEQVIFQFIIAALRESLGKYNEVPSIDFDQRGNFDIPVAGHSEESTVAPTVEVNTAYNPFEQEQKAPASSWGGSQKQTVPSNWDDMYVGLEHIAPDPINTPTDQAAEVGFDESDFAMGGEFEGIGSQQSLVDQNSEFGETYQQSHFLQLKGKYILTPVKSGLMVIDQRRAHERILFEQFMGVLQNEGAASQQQLFPQSVELDPASSILLGELMPDLYALGFEMREVDENVFSINGVPAVLGNIHPGDIIGELLAYYQETEGDIIEKTHEKIAQALASASAINYGQELEAQEVRELVDGIFSCVVPNFSPSGKPIINIVQIDDLEKMF
ncbi:DNA mismatch repair endonuclease MutL [Prolixibacteraceae bacterium JC049]|nr:DNA mismatch repair endonuclease MutL [Prolixibacteraceae bacterium JC049]